MENKMEIITIDGVECYELNGTAYLKLETVARGLGFTQTQNKNGKEYTSIRWETVYRYLEEIGFPSKLGKEDYIPENIFYRLAMKAKNETAEAFQEKVADEIIPSIRKHGGYIAGQETMSNEEFLAKAVLMAQSVIAEKEAKLQEANAKIAEDKRKVVVAMIRSLAHRVYNNDCKKAYSGFYKELRYKKSICLSQRDGGKTKLDTVRDDEWEDLIQVAAAMLEEHGIPVQDVVHAENVELMEGVR